MSFLKKLLKPALYAKKELILLLARSIWWGVSGILRASCMKYIIDGLQMGDWNMAKKYLIYMIAISLVNLFSMSFIFRIWNYSFVKKMQEYLYPLYMRRIIVGDNNKIESLGTSQTNTIMQRGVDNWGNMITNILFAGIKIIIGITLALIAIFSNTGWIGVTSVLAFLIISLAVNRWGNKSVAELRRERRDFVTQSDRTVIRLIMSKGEVLQNQKIEYESQKIRDIFGHLMGIQKREEKKRIVSFDVQRILFSILQIGLVFFIGWGVYKGNYTLGVLSMIWMLLNQIENNLMQLNDFVTSYHQTIVYIEKLRDTFDDMPEILGYDKGKIFTYKNGDIMFKNVSYKYTDNEVIKALDLHIMGEKKTAFVGVSGSGKSTLIKLIGGYIHPTSGAIFVDNQQLPAENDTITQNHDTIALKTYYPHIGYLTQEPNVFDGTVRENLLYGVSQQDVSEDDMERVLMDAQCHFVLEFKDGLDTEIGEKGIRLSGGQRQRLAIAKIMLKNPKIVLLDEPTSALDSFSEEEVTKALDRLFIGRTVIIIAHRLQTVKKADEIIVLDQGQVVERGTHEQLVQQGGEYAKMLELQSGF